MGDVPFIPGDNIRVTFTHQIQASFLDYNLFSFHENFLGENSDHGFDHFRTVTEEYWEICKDPSHPV